MKRILASIIVAVAMLAIAAPAAQAGRPAAPTCNLTVTDVSPDQDGTQFQVRYEFHDLRGGMIATELKDGEVWNLLGPRITSPDTLDGAWVAAVGDHTVSMSITNRKGEVLAACGPITFTVLAAPVLV